MCYITSERLCTNFLLTNKHKSTQNKSTQINNIPTSFATQKSSVTRPRTNKAYFIFWYRQTFSQEVHRYRLPTGISNFNNATIPLGPKSASIVLQIFGGTTTKSSQPDDDSARPHPQFGINLVITSPCHLEHSVSTAYRLIGSWICFGENPPTFQIRVTLCGPNPEVVGRYSHDLAIQSAT